MDIKEIEDLIGELLDVFYRRRIDNINNLKLRKVLARKNPYLYRAIGVKQASEIVKELLIAFASSSDEGIFGDAIFEPLAEEVANGIVSEADGVDIFDTDNKTYYRAIAVKSGINAFNASSRKKQGEYFRELRGRIAKRKMFFDAIVGYGYGKKDTTGKDFRELAGQVFWEEITGDSDFYLRIIHLIGNKAEEHLRIYQEAFTKAVERFTQEFEEQFCFEDGLINWDKLVQFNSGRPCRRITVTPKQKSLDIGEELKLKVIATLGNEEEIDVTGSEDISYEISDEDILEVTSEGIAKLNNGKPGTKVKVVVSCYGRQNTVAFKVKQSRNGK